MTKQLVTDSELMLDVGQANELKLAFRRGLWTNTEIKTLCEGDLLCQIRSALHGHAKIEEAIIDTDRHSEVVPDFFGKMPATIEVHQKLGELRWNPFKVRFYQAPGQQQHQTSTWKEIRKALAGKKLLNATIMKFLIDHQEYIPKNWPHYDQDGYNIYFPGTIYRSDRGFNVIRYMSFGDTMWKEERGLGYQMEKGDEHSFCSDASFAYWED